MKFLFPFAFLLATALSAQTPLPTRTVTIFKNGRALFQKSGKVAVQHGRYTTRNLPEALFGTFWASAASGELASVFSARDSVEVADWQVMVSEILQKNKDKKVGLFVNDNSGGAPQYLEGWFERMAPDASEVKHDRFLFRTADGHYLLLREWNISRFEFKEAPVLDFFRKKPAQRLELNFRNADRKEQDINLLYLADSLGWTPVYRLDLSGKAQGHLALRAEVANDAEDLGDAELRLAVGIPNFAFATQKSLLTDFDNYMLRNPRESFNLYGANSNAIVSQSYAETYEERVSPAEPPAAEGSQAEDFYFYSIRPGNFPKHSRYQYPIFETDVTPEHFYECVINANLAQESAYGQNTRRKSEDRYPATHYIEFKNSSTQPWTTGAVNILSLAGQELQPVSQDMLPYTPPGGTCKVRIAVSPEIKVTHVEGVKDRKENYSQYFNRSYDLISVEGQAVVVNYKSEPVRLKVRRSLEGKPLSSEQKWKLSQEEATLRVNSTYEIEWEIELKPGEERKWKYAYEVLVDL